MSRRTDNEAFGSTGSLLADASAFGASLAEFDRLADGLDVGAWLGARDVRSGQGAVRRLVAAHAEFSDPRHYFADRKLFGDDSDTSRGPVLGDALWSITTALLDGPRAGERDVERALRLAFGRDPISRLFGAALGGRLPEFLADPVGLGDFPDVPDEDRIPFETLNEIGCYVGLRDALDGVARAASAVGRTKPYPGMTITALQPATGCPPDAIRVVGTGFRSKQPADAVVVFGSTRAEIVRRSWSDTAFSVRIPKGVGECCVSVLQVARRAEGGETLAAAVSDLAGVVTECFGAVGIALGGKLEQLARQVPDAEEAVCAPDGSNRFIGGPPRISHFRTTVGSSSPQKLPPGQRLELEWSIVNAHSATIRITPGPGTSPLAVTPSLPSWFVANPTSGRAVVPTVPSLVPWTVNVELRATNACGSTTERIQVTYDPAPGLVFVGGGMRSSFDLGAIEAFGLLLAADPVVCAGSGLGALSAACAAADYPNPASLRAFWDSSADDSSWYVPHPAINVPGADYQAIETATWQARARAEVLTMDALGLLRNFMVPHKPADDRQLEMIIAAIAGVAAEKAIDTLGHAVEAALREAGQTALSNVPIVAIVWYAAKFARTALNDALKQQTANALASAPALFDDAGLQSLLRTATAGIQQRLQASGRRLRIPLTSLEKGRALYGLEAGGVSEPPVGSQIRANTSVATVVQAAATVPYLGGPKIIGADHYVDGSLRDPVPIGATIEAGAGSVIVIQPHVRSIGEEPAFAGAGIPRIDARSSVVRDAQSLDGAVSAFGRFARDPATRAPVGAWRVPVLVIEPTVDLVGLGASVGQSSLASIMADYGYMRTYDSVAPWLLFPRDGQQADRDQMVTELSRSTDKIVGLRVKAWQLEHQLNGWRATPFGPTARIGRGPLVGMPEQSAIADIRTVKSQIRAAIVDRLAITGRYEARAAPSVPLGTITAPAVPRPRAEDWVQSWEKQNFFRIVKPVTVTPAQPDGDPWVSLTFTDHWTEPAGSRPAPIWSP
jgi:NTE family protein